MASKTKVFLRADGNHQIGLGHVHRCLALAEVLKLHFDCYFIIKDALPGLSKLILSDCKGIIEVKQKDRIAEAHFLAETTLQGNEIVILDGYEFNTEYQTIIKTTAGKVVSIDDIHAYPFVVDAIINHAGGVSPSDYSGTTKRFYLGPRYALLKMPFLKASKKREARKGPDRLLICLGGADPTNQTLSVLNHCLQFAFESCYVIIGEGYVHRESLPNRSTVSRNVEILSNLSPVQMLHTMKQCNVAVCSPSGVAYEYLTVGGELYLKPIAENQKDLYDYLTCDSLAFSFDDFRVNNKTRIESSLKKQGEIFDGYSDERLLKVFFRLDYELNGRLRRAGLADLMVLFEWANDPDVRRQSYTTDPIPLDQHTEWFNRKLKDPHTYIYLYEYKDQPIGHVRFDVANEATISFIVGTIFQGKGLGSLVLEKSIETFKQEYPKPITLVGYVKKDNKASSLIFTKLGFASSEANEHKDSYKYKLDANGTGNHW